MSEVRSQDSAFARTCILITVSTCTMLYALTLTIVSVALPQLQGALSATPDQVSWVVTLNVVATAIVTPLTGWLVARIGQRRLLIWSVAAFSVSSLLCATANSLWPLIIYRIFQGAAGAPLVPMAQAIIVATYPPEQRAMAQGLFGMSVVIGPALAPALGGYLAEVYNWRWIFLLILPLCVIALVGVLLFIRDGGKRDDARLDWTGFIALSLGVTCLQLFMDRGERLDWFESTEIVLIASMMGLSFYLFLSHTFTSAAPFISPKLLLDRNFTVGLLLVFIYGMLNITPAVLIPPMLQNLKGYPDSLIGLLLAMRGVGMIGGFFIAGQMGRFDPRVGLVIGLSLIALSGYGMALIGFGTSANAVAWMGVIQGLGCGIMWVPLSVVTFATLRADLLPDASAIFHLLRNFGSSIFISICVLAIARTGKISYAELTENVSPFNESLGFASVLGRWSYETTSGLASISGEILRQAQMIGYENAFWLYTAVCVLSVPFLAFVKIQAKVGV